ncbi:MAG: hypothetical protein HOP96_12190 [Sphingomonas sp.]|nr:hypothetical protein [Sphingomonas sp.]
MNLFWDLYWPAIVAAVVIGVIAGAIGFRRKTGRNVAIVAGVAAALVLTWGWHGPGGAAERLATTLERTSRDLVVAFEMSPVQSAVERHPLRRTLVLSGPADDFQRSELARILDELPGVAGVRWADMPAGFTLPVLAEAELAALISFGLGLLLAYLLELRRRSNAQWRW